jgi:hypothetical protein
VAPLRLAESVDKTEYGSLGVGRAV